LVLNVEKRRLRYVGKMGKLYPEDPIQAMKCDEIIGLQEVIPVLCLYSLGLFSCMMVTLRS